MDNTFIVFGVASLQVLPILTLTYLQNEISSIKKVFDKIQAQLLSIVAMVLSFCLIFVNILPMGLSISMIISILLIITLSISINYTYKDYTIEEGYYISIPYFIIYSSLVFVISITEYPFYTIQSYSFSLMILCSFICYILFSMRTFIGIEFHSSLLNYIAFIGLLIATFNIMIIIDYNRFTNNQFKFIINFSMFQFIHIYLYLTHLLGVKFEINAQSECKFSNIFKWCYRNNNNNNQEEKNLFTIN